MKKQITPEKAVLRQIMDFLDAKRILYIRHNSIKFVRYSKSDQRLVPAPIRASQVGAPDIICWPCNGLLTCLAIECKSSIGRQSKEQKDWQIKWERLGYIYIIARDVEDLIKIIS